MLKRVLNWTSDEDGKRHSSLLAFQSSESAMRITLDPPLRGITVLDQLGSRPIRFTALVEFQGQLSNSCNIALWHGNPQTNDWTETAFKEVENTDGLVHIHGQESKPSSNYKILTLDLPYEGSAPLQYTLKYRLSQRNDWTWSGKGKGENDGRIIFRMSEQNREPSVDISELFSNVDASITFQKVSSDVSYTAVWDVGIPAPASTMVDTVLGLPAKMERFLAPRINPWPWMAPEHGRDKFHVGNNSYMLAFIRSDGLNVVVLPFSGSEDCVTYLGSDDSGNVLVKGRNDGAVDATFRCIISTGYNFQRAVDAAFYRAKTILYNARDLKIQEEEKSKSLSRSDRWIDGLGYCTWNGIGPDLTEDKIVNTLKDLETTGVKISTLIIDDNWQSLDNRRWVRFEANKEGFPNGLKGLSKIIKTTFPYVQNIAVWHTLFGYWDCIAPGGDIDKTYKCVDVNRTSHVFIAQGKSVRDVDVQDTVRVVDSSDIGKVYEDFYKFLSESGMDGVKCDDECFCDEIGSPADRARLTKPYQDALRASGTKYFGHKIIYCMAHIPNVMFHSLLLRDRRSVLFRNSDDFFPQIPDSHTWHVFTNALNNIYTEHLNAYPDWDMFQSNVGENISKDVTKGESYGALHAVARCISGGPIYITDSLGGHDVSVLNQMVAPSPAGYSVTLRPSTTALPSNPYNGYNDNKLLRVNNFYGSGKDGTSLMAILNISKQPLSEMLSFGEFRGSHPDVEYLVRACRSGDIFGGKTRDDNSSIAIHLPEVGWELFSAVPLQSLPVETKSTMKICTFGLLGQITGACAVTATDFKVQKNGRITYEVKLKALGTLGIWFSDLQRISIDDILVCIDDEAVPQSVITITKLLEIDILSAWTEINKEKDYYSSSTEDVMVKIVFKY